MCSNCNELNKIISPFSPEAVECEHLLFCWQAVILISYDQAKETWFHCFLSNFIVRESLAHQTHLG